MGSNSGTVPDFSGQLAPMVFTLSYILCYTCNTLRLLLFAGTNFSGFHDSLILWVLNLANYM